MTLSSLSATVQITFFQGVITEVSNQLKPQEADSREREDSVAEELWNSELPVRRPSAYTLDGQEYDELVQVKK
jgi:hypothetical protein